LGGSASTWSAFRLVKQVTRLILIGSVVSVSAFAFNRAISGVFNNSLSYAVNVELMNPKGFVYSRFAIPGGSTVVSPVINGIAQIGDSKQRIVATGRTVRPSEIKSYFGSDRAVASNPPAPATCADNLRPFSRSRSATSPCPTAAWGRHSLLARCGDASKLLQSLADKQHDQRKSALCVAAQTSWPCWRKPTVALGVAIYWVI
jgi:hypothetical protein